MIVLNCEQRSPEWFQARLGIPTASAFDKIITPTGKVSTQAETYMNKLLAEWLTGTPANTEPTEWMERGKELEASAVSAYSFITDEPVESVGLVYLNDLRQMSCSPDGLVRDEGGLEIKCPAPWTHVEYLLANTMPNKYAPQVQGNMYITGRAWWDFFSYCPGMDPVLIRVSRNDEYIEKLSDLLDGFIKEMLDKRRLLRGDERASA